MHENLDKLRSDFDKFVTKELERQRTLLEDKTSNNKAADKEALERLQVILTLCVVNSG